MNQSYYIPANFTDAGKLFGMFAIRNAVEAAILAVPLCLAGFLLLPFEISVRAAITMVVAVPIGGFALIGVDDDSLTTFLTIWWRWRSGRGILTYRGSERL